LRKFKRYILFVLMGILGILLLVFLFLNLPPTQRYATRQVNQILAGSKIPVHINALRKILPGSVRVQGIHIYGPQGDTLIYAGELQSDIRLISLLRHKIIVKDLELDAVFVELIRSSNALKINIAEAFTEGRKRDRPAEDRAPARWKISIRKGELSNIRFRMNDSISGIHIWEDVSAIALDNFNISIPGREIYLRSLFLDNALGKVFLTPMLKPPKKRKGPPWNLSFQKLAMEDTDLEFFSSDDSLRLRTSIGKANIRANAFDLVSRRAHMKKIDLDEWMFEILEGGVSGGNVDWSKDESWVFLWELSSEAIEIRNSTLKPGLGTGKILNDIDLQVGKLRLEKNRADLRIRKLAFGMNNGFTLENMRGKLESVQDLTELELDIKTGHSRINLNAFAESAYGKILASPQEIGRTSLEIKKSHISLKDISGFRQGLEEWPSFVWLSADPFEMEGNLTMENKLLDVKGLSISMADNFAISLDGNMHNTFKPPDANINMNFEISRFNQCWLEGLVSASGYEGGLPDLSDLTFLGNISDSLMCPDFHLTVAGHLGSMEALGSLDFQKKLFTLDYSFQGLALAELVSFTEFGTFTGAGEIKGRGFSLEEMLASFYLQVDTIGFKGYNLQNSQLTGTIAPGQYGVQLVSSDPAFKGDMQLDLSLSDSTYTLFTHGILRVQLDQLQLLEDTLGIQTSIEGYFSHKRGLLKSELHAWDMTFVSPQKTAQVNELTALFEADSISSLLQADADFFHADLHMVNPLKELDSLGVKYQNYFESFRKASHIAADNRVSVLPIVDARLSVTDHDLIDILLGDSALHIATLNASIGKHADQNSLFITIIGSDVSFKALESDKFSAVITDSAGSIKLELLADSISLFSGPENRLRLNANTSDRKLLAGLSVDDYQDQSLYEIKVAGRMDSSQIVLDIPDQKLTLNGEDWQLEGPELLSIDLAENLVLPALQMKRDTSFLHLDVRKEDSFINYALDLNHVDLTSLIGNDLFLGSPDGILTGALEYGTDRNSKKKFTTNLLISDINFAGNDYGDIRLNAAYSGGTPEGQKIDLSARTDSLDIRVKGQRSESGYRHLEGNFTEFPLVLLEPFTEEYVSEVEGSLSGNFNLSSQRGREDLMGQLFFQDARVKINLLNSVFRVPDQRIEISDQRVIFDDFTILDTIDRALKVDGFVQFGGQKPPMADLDITSSELQVMSREKMSKTAFSGNVFVDSRISISGPLARPNMEGIIHLSKGTEIFYHHTEDLRMTETDRILNFVGHSPVDGELLSPPPLSGEGRIGSSTIGTVIEIDPNTQIHFTLARRMFDIQLNIVGGGNIQYNLENERMALSGRYEIREGTTLLKLIGWPDKSFSLTRGGYIRWDGMVENPELNLAAENKVSTSYVNPIDGKNRDIDFFVILRLTGYLSDLNVEFTLRTPDQYVMSVINTLGPEEQMRQAISVLLFESIDLPGISSSTSYVTQQVNQILSAQLNQLTRSAIKGVDISFGLDTYDQSSMDGSSETTTSLSYEVRKSFLNNRAQIEFSGRLKDVNQASTTTDHSLNNLSFEYALDSAASKYLKVYNEHSYDDVFEGEVIKTGIGFSYKKRYRTLKDIWRRKE
jgi:hypothetical protein